MGRRGLSANHWNERLSTKGAQWSPFQRLRTTSGETQTGGYILHQWISTQIAGEDEQDWASVLFRCFEWSLCLLGCCWRHCSLCWSVGPAICLCACVPSGNTYPAALPLAGPGDSLLWQPCIHGDRSDPGARGHPHGGQSHCIWLPLTFHSCNPQPATEQFHAQGSCTGQAHTAGSCFSWIAFLLPYLTAPGSCLRSNSESWHLPPLYVPLMKVHASSALKKLSKCGGITTKQSPLRVTTCFLQQTAITVVAMVQMDTASSCKTPPLGKWVELP